ncbi:MAG: PAS domain S-box protein [Betaproteobacteria bacterium]
MSVPSPTALRAPLPASAESADARAHRPLTTYRIALVAVCCCVIAMLVTTVYLQRQKLAAWTVAGREMSTAAAVAADDYAFISGQIADRNGEARLPMVNRLNDIDARIRRLTGMQALFIDGDGKPLSPAENSSTEQMTATMLVDLKSTPPGVLGSFAMRGDGMPFLFLTKPLPGNGSSSPFVAILVPEQEMLAAFGMIQRNALIACSLFVLLMITMAWALSRHLLQRNRFEAAILERESMLDAQRMHLEETYRIAQLGHFYWNLETDELELNSHDISIYGYMPSQHFRSMREWQAKFCHPEDLADAEKNRRLYVDQGKPYTTQRRTFSVDGKLHWLDVTAEPVKDNDGKAIAYRGAFRDITAEKVGERHLIESEQKFRLISENMHDQVGLYARDGTILYASPSTMNLLGFDSHDAIGKSPFSGLHADDVEHVKAAVEHLESTPDLPSITAEFRYRHRDGRYLWLQTIIVPVRDGSGALLHFQASTRDVTQRRDAEEQLRRSEERFRALTEISSDWYWETDEQHQFSFLSLQQTLLTRQKQDEILGKTRWDLFPDALKAGEWQEHRATLDARRPFQGLIMRILESGSSGAVGYFSLSGRPMFCGDGHFLGYRGTGRDITRIKLSERQLAESEERYRLITQNMRDLISLHSGDGKLLYVSPSFRTITGHDLWAIIGVSARYLLHPEDSLWVRRRYVDILAGRDVPTRLTYRLRHRAGHHLWLETQVTLVRNVDGSLLHVQAASRDVTARREAEIAVEKKTEELARANKLLAVEIDERQELERNILMTIEMELAQVGLELHDELGQDLTGIALLSKSLERRLAEKGWTEAVDATRISELVNRTIRHTRMISHGLSPYIWGTDGLVAALTQLASDINSLGVVECITELDSNISIQDEIVARSLYRIAQESINNGLKHSRAQRLTLTLAGLRGGIALTISDNGVGHTATDAQLESGGRFHSIRHRCRAIDAALTVRHAKRGGTVVKVVWKSRPANAALHQQAEQAAP